MTEPNMRTQASSRSEVHLQLLREQARRSGSYPLSEAQQAVWYHQALNERSASFNLPLAICIHGEFEEINDVLAGCLQQVVDRQSILRTTFHLQDEEPVQRVHDAMPVTVQHVDLPSAESWRAGVDALMQEQASAAFALQQGPLFRFSLVKVDHELHVLVATFHHLVMDGWSIGIFLHELGQFLYVKLGGSSALVPLQASYQDCVLRQRVARRMHMAQGLHYWQQRLQGAASTVSLPLDRQRPDKLVFHGETVEISFGQEVSQGIAQLATRHGATPFMVMLAAYFVLLQRVCDQDDMVVMVSTANRDDAASRDLLGLFADVMPLRATLDPKARFSQVLAEVGARCLEDYEHAGVSLTSIMECVPSLRAGAAGGVSQAGFDYQNSPWPASIGSYISLLSGDPGWAKMDLNLSVSRSQDVLVGRFEYNSEILDRSTVKAMADAYAAVLGVVVADPDARAAAVPLQPTAVCTSTTPLAVEQVVDVDTVLARLCLLDNGAASVCLECAQGVLDHDALAARVGAVASALVAAGVIAGDRVGLHVNSGADHVIALLACLRLGAVCCPLDPALPVQRMRIIADNCGLAVIVAARASPPPALGRALQIVYTDAALVESTGSVLHTATDAAAYVIHTSGSSGVPKGVVVPRSAVAAFVVQARQSLGLRADDRVLQFASPAFDTSLEEVLPALDAGATLVERSADMMGSMQAFLAGCERARITVLDLPTAFWHGLVEALHEGSVSLPTTVRLVIIGGEAASIASWRRWCSCVSADVRLLNTYGPTEATISVTVAELTRGVHDAETLPAVPIGRPHTQAMALVLDRDGQPVPDGLPGELHIAGPTLASGYLQQPALTAAAFICRPDAAGRPLRMYRTGDRVRRRVDGQLDYLGRLDGQLKINGHRLEPEDVEASLRRCEGVRDVAAVAVRDEAGQLVLRACVVGSADAASLREHASQTLPVSLQPVQYLLLPALPVTVSHKVDRRALAALSAPKGEAVIDVPADDEERHVAQVWSALMGGRDVGRNDDFFSIGGHSMLMIRLLSRLRTASGVELSLADAVADPTIAGMARLIRGRRAAALIPNDENVAATTVHALGTHSMEDLTAHQDEASMSMTPLAEVLALAARHSVTFTVMDDRLKVIAGPTKISAELRDAIRASQPALLAYALEKQSVSAALRALLPTADGGPGDGGSGSATLTIVDGRARMTGGARPTSSALQACIDAWNEVLAELRAPVQRDPAPSTPTRLVLAAAATEWVPGDPIPLSAAQERLWFIDRMGGGSAQYNVPVALRIRGAFNLQRLQQCLQIVVDRHLPLRIRYDEQAGNPTASLHPEPQLRLAVSDLRGQPAAARDALLQSTMETLAARPFNLASDLMIRADFVHLAEDDGVLLVCMHHIATDGWSLGVLAEELMTLYTATTAMPDAGVLPALAFNYLDFARCQQAWSTSEARDVQLAYWERTLKDLPVLHSIPTDHPRPAWQSFRGGHLTRRLDASLRSKLEGVARQSHATLFMVLHAAWALALSRLSSSNDIVVGTPVAYRCEEGLERLIGCFVNTLVLRVDCTREGSFGAFLAQVRACILGAQEHQDVGLEQLVEHLKPRRSTAHAPLFQLLFSMNVPPEDVDQASRADTDIRIEELDFPWHSTKFDLGLTATLEASGLRLDYERCVDLFDEDTLQRLAVSYEHILALIAADADLPLQTLVQASADECQHLLTLCATEASGETLLHPAQQLLQTAARTPHAVAVVHGQQQLTFAELDAMSSQLALHLRTLQPRDGACIAVHLGRSMTQLVAMLAIWKAGAVHVPVPITLPDGYRKHYVTDTQVDVVVCSTAQASRWAGRQVVVLDDPRVLADIGRYAPGTLAAATTLDSQAYVIHTSGSTGVPKGVRVDHRALAGFCTALLQFLADKGITGHSWAWNASVGFDASLQAVAWLLSGGCVHILDEPVRQDPAALLDYLDRHAVDVLDATPRQVELLLDADDGTARWPHLVIGGEEIVPATWAAIASRMDAVQRVAVNVYGPTETTVDATGTIISATASPNIGRPLPGVRCMVLESGQTLAAVGAVGELFVGGGMVASGYVGRRDDPGGPFLPNPWCDGERMYRTGDLVRWRTDGQLEYLGRADGQIKVRGYRVEPDGVAGLLRTIEGVAAAAVLVEEHHGDRSLVGCVVATGCSGTPALSGAMVRARLQQLAPDYMVPSRIHVLAALPLTANGKLDRAALAALAAEETRLQEAPAQVRGTAGEELVARLMAEDLPGGRLGIDQDFFERGGHSILAVRAVSRIESVFQHRLRLDQFFSAPSPRGVVTALASHLGSAALVDEVARIHAEVEALSASDVVRQLAETVTE